MLDVDEDVRFVPSRQDISTGFIEVLSENYVEWNE